MDRRQPEVTGLVGSHARLARWAPHCGGKCVVERRERGRRRVVPVLWKGLELETNIGEKQDDVSDLLCHLGLW